MAIRWLRKNVPAKFWEKVQNFFDTMDYDNKAEIRSYNRRNGHGPTISYRKHLSYMGAVRLPEWVPQRDPRRLP